MKVTGAVPYRKAKKRILISDAVVLLFMLLAAALLAGRLIPDIDRIYHLKVSDTGTMDIGDYLFSGAKWFSVSLGGYQLPQHKWYIVLLIAAMVQCIADEIQSFLSYGNIDFGSAGKNFIVNKLLSSVIITPVATVFTLQLTRFFILAICPQDIPLLFLLGEAAVLCLPALIHKYLIKKDLSLFSLGSGIVQITLLYFSAKTESAIPEVLLLIVKLADHLFSYDEPSEPEELIGRKIPGAALCTVFGIWVASGVMIIRPVVYTHMPEIKVTKEEVFCSDIIVEEYSTEFIRTDSCLVDHDNEVIFENVKQKCTCCENRFYLTNDGSLWIYDGKGTSPAVVMEDVALINCFRDGMIIIDEKGALYGFGDFGNYLPGEPYFEDITLLEDSYDLVGGDMGRDHILLTDRGGDLYSMGGNSCGELGTGTRSLKQAGIQYVMSDVQEAKAGCGTSYALTTDGRLFSWGRNDVGQLGTGIVIPDYSITKDYAVNAGILSAAEPLPLDFSDTKITDIAPAMYGAFALDEDGNVWAWGKQVTRDSIAVPFMIWDGIKKIRIAKNEPGMNIQKVYLITDEDAAIVKSVTDDKGTFENSISEIVFDPSNWMPEPVEEISSILERFLDRINVRIDQTEDDEDTKTQSPAVPTETALKPGYNERRAYSRYLEFGGHTYRVFDEFLYMKNAESVCESMGGHLAVITSKEEHDFLCSALNEGTHAQTTFHIGLHYDGTYSWVTGEDASYVTDVHAKQAEIKDGEGCLRSDGRMSVGMKLKMPYICEWDHTE